MKKVLLVIAMVAAGFTANAQDKAKTAKGGFAQEDVYVSGTVGFSSASMGDNDSSSYTFSPSVGYFISENIALELGLAIGGSDTGVEETSTLGVALAANYFFTPQNDFSFVLGAGLGYANTEIEGGSDDGLDVNSISIAVAPGVNYFVSESVALRASVGALSYTNAKQDGADDALNTFALNLDLSAIQFGLTYKF
ncbi:outer membrane beta-barrel protein [Tenacibaculum aestuariivivum]|uniref:outer membrane beta-barrel protein n=1 Tax=Tenacibaculum aestuariivivum TaxID=2006131 RepID=UPI003AB39655